MSYRVKEAFYTLQGEGEHAGTPAVFVRLSMCNLWDGREEHRERDAAKGGCARWCDTQFRGIDGVNGGAYTSPEQLADLVRRLGPDAPIVVLTGGEPALQVDALLVASLRARGLRVHVETNGTLPLPPVDWVTLSPKPPAGVVLAAADEVKLVFDPLLDVEAFRGLAERRWLQPRWDQDTDRRKENEASCIKYIIAHPWWRLSLQTHKLCGML